MAHQHVHKSYIPHIDGIRCLAVMPVVINHIMSSACPGGFMGVDVFFVISGYLICGGILRDLDARKFSMGDFYYRRAKRILPAYFVVLLAVLVAAVLLYPWSRLVPLAQTSLFSIGFSTNIYFWLAIGYFQPDAHDNPLLHFWSLGVEEHFYLIAPLAFLLVWKLRKSWIFPLMLIAGIASLILCIVLGWMGESTTAFYVLPTRAWEMLAGALICRLPKAAENNRNSLMAFIGLMLVAIPFWSVSTESTQTGSGTNVEVVPFGLFSLGITPFPGLVLIPTVIGTMLLIRYGSLGLTGKLLSSRFFVGIGLISYSLYLWHWPVLVFCRYVSYDSQSHFISLLVFVLSIGLAYASWRWVENPVRKQSWYTRKVALWSTVAGAGTFAAFCALLVATQGLRYQIHPDANIHSPPPRDFSKNLEKLMPKGPAFRAMGYPDYDPNYVRLIGDTSQAPSFCLIGDSHAEAISDGLHTAAIGARKAGYYIDRHMHPFIGDPRNNSFFEWIISRKDITDVYLAGRWMNQMRINSGMPSLGDSGKISEFTIDGATGDQIENNFRSTVEKLSSNGKNVYIFTTVPEYDYHPCDLMARSKIIPTPLPFPIHILKQDYTIRQNPISKVLGSLAAENLIQVVPLGESFFRNRKSIFMSESGHPYYSDGNHLTKEGSIFAANLISPYLWDDRRWDPKISE